MQKFSSKSSNQKGSILKRSVKNKIRQQDSPIEKKVEKKVVKKGIKEEKILATASCPTASGIIVAQSTLEAPCFTFTCDAEINIHDITVEKTPILSAQTLIDPFESLPVLSPGSDSVCPDTPNGGDPLVTSVIDQNQSITLSWITLTNTSDHPTAPSPTASSGPWYFEKEPYSSSGKTTITCGCRETFDPTSLRDDERFPPHESNTNSTIDITFDVGALDPRTEKIALDLVTGYSSEANYDFFTVSVDGVTQFQSSGPGASVSDPYKHQNLSLIVKLTATVRINYYRDPGNYGGVDSVYFRIAKAQPIFKLSFPTTLVLQRGSTILKDYTSLMDFDGTQTSLTVECDIAIQTGDQLCLDADPEGYSSYTVNASYQKIPQIKDHRYQERFVAPIDLGIIAYDKRQPVDKSLIQGWYNTDDQFSQNLIYITPVSGCSTGGPDYLDCKRYSLASSGPYYVNSFWGGGSFKLTEVSRNVYQTDAGQIFNFDPSTGELRLDTSSTTNLPGVGNGAITIFRPAKNADERYWQYDLDLTDYDREFNTPYNFFDFVGQYYKSGFISSQFGTRSRPTWPDINPLAIDQTQVRASYGVANKAQYDDLFHRLQTVGICRSYKISRWIYWPYPGPEQPQLSPTQQASLRWVVNQQRYPFLGFAIDTSNMALGDLPHLCPGETVKIYNTGTRLDGFPLRLAMDGYRANVKTPRTVTQTYSGIDPRNNKFIPSEFAYDNDKEGSYYTLRLPITIDSTNDTVYSRRGGMTRYGDPDYEVRIYTTTTPNINLPVFNANSAAGTPNILLSPVTGNLVIADPLIADTPLINAAQVAGNVVLIQRGAVPFSTKITNAYAAGATGVIIFNTAANPTNPPIMAPIGSELPTVGLGYNDGIALQNAILGGSTVTVNAVLESPMLKTTLPHGTFYLSDLLQGLFDDYVNGISEFYIEVGNFIAGYYGWNDLFALGCTSQALLYGPNDPLYKSTFLGPMGLDIGFLWDADPTLPISSETQFLSNPFFDATYAQLVTGEYKTHTPLTSSEADKLLRSLNSKTSCTSKSKIDGAYVKAKHGPITYDMPYEKYVACISELALLKGTEVHNVISPWCKKCDNGLYELHTTMQEVLDALKQITIDPSWNLNIPANDVDGLQPGGTPLIPDVPIAATFAPTIYCMPIRITGLGSPGEFSELYTAGLLRRSTEQQSRGEARLEWIIPRGGDILKWPSPTILPNVGDVSGRAVEIPIVNYLEDPVWLGTTTVASGPYAGAPDYYFIPYNQHSGDTELVTPEVKDPNAVPGDWLCGVLKDDKVRSILNIPSNQPVPRCGYITWYISKFGSKGDSSLLPFFDPSFSSLGNSGIMAAARVLQLFNQQQVKHIIVDVRDTIGGADPFWNAFCALVGGKRYFNMVDIVPVMTLEPNGIQSVRTPLNFQVAKEQSGEVTYRFNQTLQDCNPDALAAGGIESLVPGCFWNGEVTGQAALGLTSNIFWISSATAISNTQYRCLSTKATSLDQQNYTGDFGKSTQFVHYGVYDRPFSTSGSYDSYLNWWTKGRLGDEENPVGLMFGLDRWESSRMGYVHGAVDGQGGILKGLDQEFGPLQEPHIKWDMNATVFFQDIGYVVGNPGINISTDGQPWAPSRYSDVIFGQPETYRDSALERIVQMAVDPNLVSHFYQEDGYGYVSLPPN